MIKPKSTCLLSLAEVRIGQSAIRARKEIQRWVVEFHTQKPKVGSKNSSHKLRPSGCYCKEHTPMAALRCRVEIP